MSTLREQARVFGAALGIVVALLAIISLVAACNRAWGAAENRLATVESTAACHERLIREMHGDTALIPGMNKEVGDISKQLGELSVAVGRLQGPREVSIIGGGLTP